MLNQRIANKRVK